MTEAINVCKLRRNTLKSHLPRQLQVGNSESFVADTRFFVGLVKKFMA